MRQRSKDYGIAVSWKGKTVYYETVEKCAGDLGITTQTIYNYLSDKIPLYGMTFEKYKISGEEKMLRAAMKTVDVRSKCGTYESTYIED